MYLVGVAMVTECMDADKQHVEYSGRNAADGNDTTGDMQKWFQLQMQTA